MLIKKYLAFITICDAKISKIVPAEAITVTDFLAEIDYSKCVDCGTCLEKCPKKAIIVKE